MRYSFNKIDLVKYRKVSFTFSIAITILGIITMLIFGLNYGVDFKAGTAVDVGLEKKASKAAILKVIEQSGLQKPEELRLGGDNQERANIRFEQVLTDKQAEQLKKNMQKDFGSKTSFEINTVDPEIAKEIARNAIIGVAIASIAIMLYTIIRFEWRFALAAIVALLHDAFIVISIFSIFQLEVNLTFVAAILTIIGYSINDTIVIFDRIRENMRFMKKKSFENLSKMVNDSIWQTMSRSINTALTVVFGALALFMFGGDSIILFSLAILIGLISGAYSSIFIASPLWLILKKLSDDDRKQALAAAAEEATEAAKAKA